jgi:hypothetical protein
MGTLTDTAIRKTEARDKAFKLADGHGLHLFVSAAGGKLWRLKYRMNGKEKLLSFGAYPAVSLARARFLAAAAHEALARGDDPGVLKAEVKQAARQAEAVDSGPVGELFSTVAELWYAEHSASKNVRTAAR